MPLVGRTATQANVGYFPLSSGNDRACDLGHKMNGPMLVKDMMLELNQIANFNAVILSHCACSSIEIPVTVVTPFVH